MKGKITKRAVEAIRPGASDSYLWDTEVPGFGVKVTPSGKRIYLLQYTHERRTRRCRIGLHGAEKTAEEARLAAQRLRGVVADGQDPAKRYVETVAELSDRYLKEHARPRKKASSVVEDERNLNNHILPLLGRMKVAAVLPSDIIRALQAIADGETARVEKLGPHALRKVTGGKGVSNRCRSLLSKMFNLAEAWGLRPGGSNPVRHVEGYPERRIERFLSDAELARLGQALGEAEASGVHPSVVAAIRLLILTGCRRGEILNLRWEHVDLDHGRLMLPDSKTGAKVVTLGAPALELLSNLSRVDGNPYVLPGAEPKRSYVALSKAWYRLRKRAALEDVRLHDLRHSFASVAAGQGESLILIGALLGHADPSTTARYAHLSDDPQRAVADRTANRIAAAMSGGLAEVVPLHPGRK